MNNHRIISTEVPKNHGKSLRQTISKDPEQLPLCTRRIRQWTEDVEYSPYTHLPSRSYSVLHCRMKQRCKEKSKTRFEKTFLHLLRRKINDNAEGFKDVSAT